MQVEQDGDSSSVRDFFKRPENEDTLHYLKRQHQEQMKRMDELEVNPMVSPLKPTKNMYMGMNRPTSTTINANVPSSTVPSSSSSSSQGQSELLRQQLRGEVPLPSSTMSSSTANAFPHRRADHAYNYAIYDNETRLPPPTQQQQQQFTNNKLNNSYAAKDFGSSSVYIKSILKETESLRDIVYQQQQDMNTLNMLLGNERSKNINLYDRLTHLESKMQMIEMNTQIPIPQRPISTSSSSASSYVGGDGRTFAYNNGYPPSSRDIDDNNNINASRIYSNNSNNPSERSRQYRNQEFISSPTTNHPFSIVDDKTTNLLFSKKSS